MLAFCLILLWVILANVGDVRFKDAHGVMGWSFWTGLMCYALTSFIALATFNQKSWGWIILVWNCVSLMIGLLMSVLWYHEPFTLRRCVAAVLVLIAIFLTE